MRRQRLLLLVVIAVGSALTPAHAEEPIVIPQQVTGTATGGCCPWTAEQLTRLSWCELETIYRQAQAGPLPCGFGRGRLIYGQDKRHPDLSSHLTSLWWKGKHFDAANGCVINQWLVGKAVTARLGYGPSRIDGQPSVILDYSDSWRSWQDVRDEARQICPDLYLGAMFIGCEARPKVFFVLQIEH